MQERSPSHDAKLISKNSGGAEPWVIFSSLLPPALYASKRVYNLYMNSGPLLKFCASLPHVKLELKWGHVMACCIHEKMFALFGLDENGKAEKYSFKVDPDRFLELTDRKGIIPAPYLARAKWVAVVEDRALSHAEAKALLRTAHQLIVRKLPKYLQQEITQASNK